MPQRKRALLISINYTGQNGYELVHSHQSAENFYLFLTTFMSWKSDSIKVMRDGSSSNKNYQPTRSNILREMSKIVNKSRDGDIAIIYFTGLGSRFDTDDSAESDGKDDVLLPLDFSKAGIISDNEIRRLFFDTLDPGARLMCIFDTCRGGMCGDLSRVYTIEKSEANSLIAVGRGARRRNSVPTLIPTQPIALIRSHDKRHSEIKSNIICISIRCLDTSDEINGYLTASLISVLRSDNNLDFCGLQTKIQIDFEQRRLTSIQPCTSTCQKNHDLFFQKVFNFL